MDALTTCLDKQHTMHRLKNMEPEDSVITKTNINAQFGSFHPTFALHIIISVLPHPNTTEAWQLSNGTIRAVITRHDENATGLPLPYQNVYSRASVGQSMSCYSHAPAGGGGTQPSTPPFEILGTAASDADMRLS